MDYIFVKYLGLCLGLNLGLGLKNNNLVSVSTTFLILKKCIRNIIKKNMVV